MFSVSFSPRSAAGTERPGPVSVAELEAWLAEWFGRPVVLTSSGRSALLLCFQQLGLERYGSRLAMSPRTAQCVFDAVIRAAFPVDPASDRGRVDATLLIHQYGHLLHDRPSGPVVEDICHAFFASPDSGARDWAGDMAVFSLPKFFPLRGMAGGIIAATDSLAADLRKRRDSVPSPDEAQRAADRASWQSAGKGMLEPLYLRALLHPSPCPLALAGLPGDLTSVGSRRADVTSTILATLPEMVLDDDWREMCATTLPFALPVFAAQEHLTTLVARLREKGCETGIFRIDRARKMARPHVQPAALLPCHDLIGGEEVRVMTDVLKDWSACLPADASSSSCDAR